MKSELSYRKVVRLTVVAATRSARSPLPPIAQRARSPTCRSACAQASSTTSRPRCRPRPPGRRPSALPARCSGCCYCPPVRKLAGSSGSVDFDGAVILAWVVRACADPFEHVLASVFSVSVAFVSYAGFRHELPFRRPAVLVDDFYSGCFGRAEWPFGHLRLLGAFGIGKESTRDLRVRTVESDDRGVGGLPVAELHALGVAVSLDAGGYPCRTALSFPSGRASARCPGCAA